MEAIQSLMQNLLAIGETTPYHCKITASSKTDYQCLDGDVTFQVENGILAFNFFPENDVFDKESYQLFAIASQEDAEAILSIPSQDFEYSVQILTPPHRGMMTAGIPINRPRMEGIISAEYFGSDITPLTRATMWFNNIPDFHGVEPLLYRSGIVKPGDEDKTPMGFRALGYIVLNARGWSVNLNEIPKEIRDAQQESHICVVKREQGDNFTAQEFEKFLEDLLPFLSFAFGKNLYPSVAIGCGETTPTAKWGVIYSGTSASYHVKNWYSLSSRKIDIAPIFQRFCEESERTRKQWCKVIQAYTASEEIANILGRYDVAEAVSFSALEGLTKSIISTYKPEARDQWLDKNIGLKHPRDANGNPQGIKDAIEFVAKRELGTTQLGSILEQTATLRNTTVHLDLNAEEDPKNACFRWGNCQSLIEVILLAILGLERIPNRSQPPTFEVMGKDILWEQRAEATTI